ncbi:hypothetical protein GCM10025776_34030 [Corallincola platygyrae]
MTGSPAPNRDSFSFQTTGSNRFIQANNGDTIILGEGAYSGNEFGNIQLNGGRVEFSSQHSEYKVGWIQINNNSSRLRLHSSTVWVNGNFTLNDGRVELINSNNVATVMVRDHFEVNSGNGRINNNGDPKKMLFYSGETTRLNDGRVWATLFADNQFVMNNGSELNGAVNAMNVVMNNGDINGEDVSGIDFYPVCGDSPVLLPPVDRTCPIGETLGAGVEWTTHNTQSWSTSRSPEDAATFQQVIDGFANDTYLIGSSVIDDINFGGTDINPHGSQQDFYLSTFIGYIEAPEDGIYEIALDGDDAVEVLIDGQVVTGWYGPHSRAGGPRFEAEIGLQQGFHTLEFRHHERSGEEYFYLYWRTPTQIANGSNFVIVPNAQLSTCYETKPPITPECPAPVAGLDFYTFDKSVGSPADAVAFQQQVDSYGRLGTEQGSSVVAVIDGSGNPHAGPDDFLSRFIGYINVTETGQYKFAVDGDDAVEILIDGEVVTGWYGAHSDCNYCTTYQAAVGLEAGYHTIEYRHEQGGGEAVYRLMWSPPSEDSFSIVPDSVFERCPPPTYEWGRVTMNNGNGSVTLTNDYLGQSPLVFVMPTIVYPDAEEDGPATVAVRNITATGFDLVQLDPPNRYSNEPGSKAMVEVDYFVTLPGRVQMPGGGEFEAGTVDTAKYQGRRSANGTGKGGWEDVNFSAVFGSTPALLGQIQTNNNPDLWKTTAIRNVSTSSAEFSIEMSEMPGRSSGWDNRPSTSETIAYLAGTGSGSFQQNNETILYEFGRGLTHSAGNRTRDLDTQCEYLNTHVNNYIDPPVLIANRNTRNGGDGGWLRRCQNFARSASFVNDEDQSEDRERSHYGEDVGYLALSYPDNTAPIYDYVITTSVDALTCKVHDIGIAVYQNSVPVTGFLGDVQISTSSDTGVWSKVDADGTLQDLGNGDARYSFVASDGGNVTLGLYNNIQETVTVTVADGLSSNSVDITFRAKGFIAEVTPWQEPSWSKPNQLAGQSFSLVLTAVGEDPTLPGCQPIVDYAGNKSLEMWQSYITPVPAVDDQRYLKIGGSDLSIDPDDPTNVSAVFNGGVATLSDLVYWDAGSISIHARDEFDVGGPPSDPDGADEIIQGSSEILFSPAALVIESVVDNADTDKLNPEGTASSGEGFVPAGAPFNVNIKAVAVDRATVTPSYSVDIALTPEMTTPAVANGGVVGVLYHSDRITPPPGWAPVGATVISSRVFDQVGDKGIANINGLTYAEVGSIRLAVLTDEWLYPDNRLSLDSGSQPDIGRFYPFTFELVSSATGHGNSSNATCGPSFTYMDDDALTVEYQVTAVNASSERSITLNYDHSIGYNVGELVLAAEDANSGTDLGLRLQNVLAEWLEGEYTLAVSDANFSRESGIVDGPFSELQLSLLVSSEQDDVNFDLLDQNATTTDDCSAEDSCTSRGIGTLLELRYGRLATGNAYGSELQALAMPIQIESFDGTRFVTETDDLCTQIPINRVTLNSEPQGQLDNIPLYDGSGQTDASFLRPVDEGQLQFTLSAPGEGHEGRAEIRFDLSDLQFLRFEWDCAANLTTCDGTGISDPPVAEGYFGRFRGNDRVIYWRETGSN